MTFANSRAGISGTGLEVLEWGSDLGNLLKENIMNYTALLVTVYYSKSKHCLEQGLLCTLS